MTFVSLGEKIKNKTFFVCAIKTSDKHQGNVLMTIIYEKSKYSKHKHVDVQINKTKHQIGNIRF